MTITARALDVLQQTDSMVVQNVRFLNNGNPVKTVPVQYPPGADQATAQANLSSIVRDALARQAADGSSVAVTPGVFLDLTTPVVQQGPVPPAGFAAWQAKWASYLQLVRWADEDIPSATPARIAQAKSDHEALWDVAFEPFI